MFYLPTEKGQGLVEYGMVIVLVAIVIAVILVVLGPQIGNVYSQVVPCVAAQGPDWCY
jgi:pilus assembly protein Flp/PilA